jgi:predicted metal-dependent hydrolase
MSCIILNGTEYSYQLIKSRRKTLAIQVKPDGAILVKAPSWVSLREIERFIRQKEGWIVKTLQAVAANALSNQPGKPLKAGDHLSVLGKQYVLVIDRDADGTRVKKDRVTVELEGDRVIVTLGRSIGGSDAEGSNGRSGVEGNNGRSGAEGIDIKAVLAGWYREMARRVLTEKASHWAAVCGVEFNTIRIKDQKSRWGSCSAKKNLNFNWRIMMAPEWVADYLVIHELCHLRHMDHSADFWALVRAVCPESDEAKRWLRERGNGLMAW